VAGSEIINRPQIVADEHGLDPRLFLKSAAWTISLSFGRMPSEVPQIDHASRVLSACGPIAQSVEQLAFNQWVAGSSPARLTTRINRLGQRFCIEVAALCFWRANGVRVPTIKYVK
jgi:hypothetical protein